MKIEAGKDYVEVSFKRGDGYLTNIMISEGSVYICLRDEYGNEINKTAYPHNDLCPIKKD